MWALKVRSCETSSAGCQSKHLWQGLRLYQDRPGFHLVILLYAEIDYFEPVKFLSEIIHILSESIEIFQAGGH